MKDMVEIDVDSGPFAEHDIFQYDVLRDRYEFSALFLEYVYDLGNWTMTGGFFERCPEMQYDVPRFEPARLGITTEPSGKWT
jgi:hypothetical protein